VSDLARIDLAYQAPFKRSRCRERRGNGGLRRSIRKARAYSAAEARAANLVIVDVDGKRGRESLAIPLEELRENSRSSGGSPKGPVPRTGRRGYLAARIAANSGIDCGYLSGGTR
jgi:hypothetical protein